eukprot:TRINITY_DN8578_c0_g1_i1.p1 TRINITY_DN8578_c0_g1~~TRINITY_DN8578_c0_g1_i1.p1  ORF type:complete len:368 (-),score=92.53 TRINITY_DN8578_c0_g1_i1:78-1181(-)
MQAVLCILVLVSSSLGLTVRDQFEAFKSEHGKTYCCNDEESLRLEIFSANLKKIEEHNATPGMTWTMKINEFADLTEEEFKKDVLGGYLKTPQSGNHASGAKVNVADLPASVDWREAGVVTDAKNQGSCGSCWAFATVENIESYAAINNVSLTKLSAQEITTCTPNPMHCGGTGGCKGSIPQLAYNYVQLFGLATDDDYPYWSGVTGMTGNCKYDLERRTPVVGITGYNTLPANDMAATMQHLATMGPLAVAGDASPWQFYGSGVFSGCSYDNNIGLNHAIQMVGYGTDEEHGDFWLVRNSWGPNWGEHGYIRMQRESELTCGTDSTPMDGTACVGGPGTDTQHVCGMCGILYDMSYPLGAREWGLP